jgi:hypothetical protein
VGELAGFSVEQEAAILVCEARKDAAVLIMDAYGGVAAKPEVKRRWWEIWR